MCLGEYHKNIVYPGGNASFRGQHKQERMAWKEMRLVPDDTERRTTVMGLMSTRTQAQLLIGVVRAVERLGQPESQLGFIQSWVGI